MIINIGYKRITVKEVLKAELKTKKETDTVGQYDHYKSLIQVASDQDEQEKANTLLHECLHVILRLNGSNTWLPDGGKANMRIEEEALVEMIANGLCDLFRNNPEFVRWFLEKLPK